MCITIYYIIKHYVINIRLKYCILHIEIYTYVASRKEKHFVVQYDLLQNTIC